MRNLVTRFATNDDGATMVEYGLLVCLIAFIAAAGAQTLGNGLNTLFGNIGTNLAAVNVAVP